VVTRDTDLAHNESEHMADALTYGVALYVGSGRGVVIPSSGAYSAHPGRLMQTKAATPIGTERSR
jgi:hypothetical protein